MELPDMPKQEEDSSLITFSGDIEEPKKSNKKEQWLEGEVVGNYVG